MYDLNQTPYDYTVEVSNRFKGLDLTDRVPDELWIEVRDIVQETGIKTIPMEKVSFNPYPNQDALSTHQLPKMLTPVPRQMIRQRQVINDKTKPTPGKLII